MPRVSRVLYRCQAKCCQGIKPLSVTKKRFLWLRKMKPQSGLPQHPERCRTRQPSAQALGRSILLRKPRLLQHRRPSVQGLDHVVRPLPALTLTLYQVLIDRGLSDLVDHEQRCDYYNNENKKEAYPDSIGSLYLIVGHRTEEQSRQASCTLVRHERQPLTPLAGILQITMLDRVIELFAGAYRTNSQVSPLKMQKALALLSEFPVERQLNSHVKLSPILSVRFCTFRGKASAQSQFESSTDFAKYAMKLGENALFKIEPKLIFSSSKSVFSVGDGPRYLTGPSLMGRGAALSGGPGWYPWRLGIITTIFWIGEPPRGYNPVPNVSQLLGQILVLQVWRLR